MPGPLGDYFGTETIQDIFTTVTTTGAPTTLAGTPKLRCYKNGSTTESSDITPTVDFDSRTGANAYAIDLTGDSGFYATGNDFQVMITAGTVGGTSVVGYIVASFSIRNRSALRPVTAGRQLVVDASGLADANMVKAGPTGSGTAQTAGDIPAKTNSLTFTVANKVDTLGAMIRTGTAQAGAASTITLDAGASATDSVYYGSVIYVIGGTGAGASGRFISSYVGATKVASVSPAWTVQPDNTSVFVVMPWGGTDVQQWKSSNLSAPATAGIPEVNVKNINNVATTAVTTVKAVQGLTTADTVVTVSGNVNGNVGGSVASLTTNNDKTGYALATGGVDATSIASIVSNVWAQAMSDISAVPAITGTILAAINWLYCLARNKGTQTATTQIIMKDDGATTLGTSTVSDDTVTFTRGKFS